MGDMTSSEIEYLARALKAPRIRDAAARLAELARQAAWTHEEYLAAVLFREVSARELGRLPQELVKLRRYGLVIVDEVGSKSGRSESCQEFSLLRVKLILSQHARITQLSQLGELRSNVGGRGRSRSGNCDVSGRRVGTGDQAHNGRLDLVRLCDRSSTISGRARAP